MLVILVSVCDRQTIGQRFEPRECSCHFQYILERDNFVYDVKLILKFDFKNYIKKPWWRIL